MITLVESDPLLPVYQTTEGSALVVLRASDRDFSHRQRRYQTLRQQWNRWTQENRSLQTEEEPKIQRIRENNFFRLMIRKAHIIKKEMKKKHWKKNEN